MADFSSGGMDWMDALAPTETYGENGFTSPSSFNNLSGLEGLFSSAGFDGGNGGNSPLMTGGGENSEATIDPNVLNWLKTNNFTLGTTGGVGGLDYSLANIFDQNHKAIGQQVGWNNSAGPLWDAATALAAGAATGGLGAGLGFTGAAASGISGAAGGALNSGLQGGNPFKGALLGGISGGMVGANPASSLGIADKTLGGIANKAISGAGSSLLAGKNPLEGAVRGATNAGIGAGLNFGANQLSNFANSPNGGQNMDFFDGTTGDSAFENPINTGGAYNSPLNNMLGFSQAPGQLGLSSSIPNFTADNAAPQTNGFSYATPDFMNGSEPVQTAQAGGNPFKEMLKSALGGVQSFNNAVPGGVGNLVGGLAGIYSGLEQRRKMGGLAGNLASLYGPNSAYAQQLRQQLVRKDAASGRRSQYGPREVELQARLADMNSRNAPTLANLYGAQNHGTDTILKSMLQLGHQFGPSLMNYMSGLSNQYNLGPNAGPQLEG